MNKPAAILICVIPVVASAWWLSSTPRADVAPDAPAPALPAATVDTAITQSREAVSTAWLPASVVSRNDARLAGEVAGRLVFVAEVGSRVKVGDPVARLDPSTLELELREAQALVARQRAEQEQAARQHERLQGLREGRLIAAAQLDEAESNLEIRRRETAQAEVGRDRARQRLAQATLRAPFTGIVAERLAQVGEYQPAGGASVRLVQTDNLELSARVPAALASLLESGSEVPIRQDGQVRQARIRAVVPAADQVSRQLELRLELDGSDWLVGSAVDVALPQHAAQTVVTAPRDALVLRPEGAYVFRVREDGTAERVAVTTGDIVGDQIGIEGGIGVGEILVVRGAERLRDGQAVAVRNRDGADANALAAINTAMKRG